MLSLRQHLTKALVNARHDASAVRNYLPAQRLGPGRNVVLSGGKFRPPYSCSVNVVDHCNLSCRNCNQAAPVLPENSADPEVVLQSLRCLARHYRPRSIYVQGGELLLHPDLCAILEAVRESRICRHMTVLTNATLLDKAPACLWQMANVLEISAYPDRPFSDAALAAIQVQAKNHHVQLQGYRYGEFRTTLTARGTASAELTQKLFRACEVAHLWGCHTIAGGYFFKCPQCIYAPRLPGSRATHDFREDGVKLTDDGSLFERLRCYLESDQPLKACGYCLGTAGRIGPHRFVEASAWLTGEEGPAEELIDFTRLEQLELGLGKYHETRTRLF